MAFVPLDGDDSVEIAHFVGRLLMARFDYVVVFDFQLRDIGLVAQSVVDKKHAQTMDIVGTVAELCSG